MTPRLAILAALAARELHGYALIEQVREDTNGLMRLPHQAVYRHLSSLQKEGLISPVASTVPRRYRLTKTGRAQLRYEFAALEQVVRRLRDRM